MAASHVFCHGRLDDHDARYGGIEPPLVFSRSNYALTKGFGYEIASSRAWRPTTSEEPGDAGRPSSTCRNDRADRARASPSAHSRIPRPAPQHPPVSRNLAQGTAMAIRLSKLSMRSRGEAASWPPLAKAEALRHCRRTAMASRRMIPPRWPGHTSRRVGPNYSSRRARRF